MTSAKWVTGTVSQPYSGSQKISAPSICDETNFDLAIGFAALAKILTNVRPIKKGAPLTSPLNYVYPRGKRACERGMRSPNASRFRLLDFKYCGFCIIVSIENNCVVVFTQAVACTPQAPTYILGHDVLQTTRSLRQHLSLLMLQTPAILALLALLTFLVYILLGSRESSLKHLPGPQAPSWIIGLQITYQVSFS